MPKFIREYNEKVSTKILKESADGTPGKTYTINGIFMQSEKANRNGRVYPRNIMEKEVSRYVKEFVEKRRAVGELGHPADPTVNPERVSHVITELHFDGDNIIGTAEILPTPFGKIVQNFIDANITFGVSSRGVGSLVQKGNIQEVQDDFYMSAVDIVLDPSAPEAFVEGIKEGKEWIWNNNLWEAKDLESVSDSLSKSKKTQNKRKFEEQLVKAFERLMGKI